MIAITATKKILLVDDHPDILRYLERLLAQPAVEFLRAGRGDEALVIARRERPDLILVDICMPGMDGLEVCEAVKRDPDLVGTRVVLMSAIIGENGVRGSLEGIRADGYFSKPFNTDALRRGVREMLH
jgi:CheY-like chemotaxis protein